MSILDTIGRQLSEPRGFGGWLIGRAMRVANRRPTRLAIHALGVQPGDIVLDMGCGTGDALALLARRTDGVVHGLDHSQGMLSQAWARHRKAIYTGAIVLTEGDFHALPYADASIDRVLASNVVYFWRDPQKVLCEILRILKPGGRLALYATDGADMAKWPFVKAATHQLYDRDALDGIFKSAAFNKVQIEKVPIGCGVQGLVATATTATCETSVVVAPSGGISTHIARFDEPARRFPRPTLQCASQTGDPHPNHPPTFYLALGTPNDRKGYITAIRAFALAGRFGDRLTLVGYGRHRRRLERWSYALGIDATVMFCNEDENSRIDVNGSNAIIILSHDHEYFSSIILSSLTEGSHIITIDRAIKSFKIYQDIKSTIVVKPYDVIALSSAMLKISPANWPLL